MKKYTYCDDFYEGTVYVGMAREIKSLWNNLSEREMYIPSHCTEPVMKADRMYGLDCNFAETYNYGRSGVMYVLSPSTALRYLDRGYIG